MSIEHRTETTNDNDQLPPAPVRRSDTVMPPQDHPEYRTAAWRRAVVGAVGLGTILGAGVVGYNKYAAGDDKTTAPVDTETSVSAPVTPGELDNVADLVPEGISAELYSSPEEIAAAYIDKKNEWINQGAEPGYLDDYDGYITDKEYARLESDKTNMTYADALYVEGWQSNPDLIRTSENVGEVHDQVLWVYGVTIPSEYSDGRDLEPYTRFSEIEQTEVIEVTDNMIIVNITATDNDNRDKNRAGEFIEDINGKYGTTQYTYVLEGDEWKVKDLTIL